MLIKTYKIIILSLLLCSCASVKITKKECTDRYVCTEFTYWSKKDHANGVTAKMGDMEFTSNSSMAKDSILEEALANMAKTVNSTIEVLNLLKQPENKSNE